MKFDALRRSYEQMLSTTGLSLPQSLPVVLAVSLQSQRLDYYHNGMLAARYPVSTAANGSGCQQDTGCTPHGWHLVEQKIGSNQPVGTVFKGRIAASVATTLQDTSNADLITSRILWLTGVESGVNCGGTVDSFSRYIYIHGTAQEQLIGSPVSHGCVRMRNKDVIELFDRVAERTPVYIAAGD